MEQNNYSEKYLSIHPQMGVQTVLESTTLPGWSSYIQTSEHHITQPASIYRFF